MILKVAHFVFFTVISRILGMIRDIFISTYIPSGSTSDILLAAFRLPNTIRSVLSEGAVANAFIPSYSKAHYNSENSANALLNKISLIMFGLTLSGCIIIEAFPTEIIEFLAPGFTRESEIKAAAHLLRIMSPAFAFSTIASLIASTTHIKGSFLPTLLIPIMINITCIIGLASPVLVLSSKSENFAIAFTTSSIIQLIAVAFMAYSKGTRFKKKFLTQNYGVAIKPLLFLMLLSILANAISHTKTWIDTIFASSIGNMISYLYYCERIVQLPQALIGVAIGTVTLPEICRILESNDANRLTRIQNKLIELSALLIIPSSVAIFTIPSLIAHSFFGYGYLDELDLNNISILLSILALSIPAYVINRLAMMFFYATNDLIPVIKISLVSISVCLMLNLVLKMNEVKFGIAYSSVVSSLTSTVLLLICMRHKNMLRFPGLMHTINKIPKIVFASAGMSVVMLIVQKFITPLELFSGIQRNVMVLACTCTAGSITYLLLITKLLPDNELAQILQIIRLQKKVKS